jgi:outer membrane murein-binding lipoprotein Lpp
MVVLLVVLVALAAVFAAGMVTRSKVHKRADAASELSREILQYVREETAVR